MLNKILTTLPDSFRTCEQVHEEIIRLCNEHNDIAEYVLLGESEEGRPIDAVILGKGKQTVSLLAGAHSDEPVGPETLRTFILEGLRQREKLQALFERFRFVIIPHVNPDGEARNWRWMEHFPDVNAYIQFAYRELPGRDIEFGYPEMRVENRLVSAFLQKHAPYVLHFSLHGMGFAEGVMLLIERHWIERTKMLRKQFLDYAASLGLPLHDHDRKGEKGFQYIAPGFTTTPEGRAMQAYFRSQGDEETARQFHLSSMEYVRQLGGNPLCLVTELPLFVVGKTVDPPTPGIPTAYLEFKARLPELKEKLSRGDSINNFIREYRIQPLPIDQAVRFQLAIIDMGLAVVEE